MILSFSGQAKLFLMTAAVGFFIGFVYDVFRIARKAYKHPNILTQLEDLVFWLFVTFVTYYFILNRNYGEIRFFLVLGVALGACLYFSTLSPLIIKASLAIINFIKAVVRTMIQILLFPFKIIIKAAKIPLGLLKRGIIKLLIPVRKLLQKLLRYAKIKLGKLAKDIKIIAKKV